MRVAVNRPEAAGLPSRRDLALFKLVALLRFRRVVARAAHARRDADASLPSLRAVHVIDPHQDATEAFSTAAAAFLVVICYLLAFTTTRWHPHPLLVIVLAIVSPLIAAFILQLPAYLLGGVLMPLCRRMTSSRNDDNQVAQTWLATSVILAASVYFARGASFARPIAIVVLALAALNAVAWIALLPMRGYIARLDEEFGGDLSAG